MNDSAPGPRLLFVAANPSIDRFIEVGELTAGTIHRPDFALAVPGGKGLNAARAAFALGGQVTAVAIVAGRAGDWIAEQLSSIGIATSLVHGKAGRETRTCLSVLDRSTGLLTEFYEPGEGIGPNDWRLLEEAIQRELQSGDVGVVVCSGSLPVDAPVDGYARIVRMAQAQSVRTVVDGHGPALRAALDEHPGVVKVNAVEAAEVTRTSAGEHLLAAQTLMRMGAEWAIVTLGSDGAVACDGTSAWHLRSHEPPGAYPVGSGDAFVAGLALSMAEGTSLQDAARQGVAAGTANALVPGAGLLEAETMRRLLGAVQVTRIQGEATA